MATARLMPYVYPAPDGWVVMLPTRTRIEAEDRAGLERKLMEVLEIGPERAKDYVDEYICNKYPSLCKGGKATRNYTLPLGDRASIALTALSENPKVPLPAEETKRRLDICNRCPANYGLTAPGCCGTPGKLEKLASGIARELGVTRPFEAGWCSVTGYNLRLVAHFAPAPVTASLAEYDHLPDNCPYKAAHDAPA